MLGLHAKRVFIYIPPPRRIRAHTGSHLTLSPTIHIIVQGALRYFLYPHQETLSDFFWLLATASPPGVKVSTLLARTGSYGQEGGLSRSLNK